MYIVFICTKNKKKPIVTDIVTISLATVLGGLAHISRTFRTNNWREIRHRGHISLSVFNLYCTYAWICRNKFSRLFVESRFQFSTLKTREIKLFFLKISWNHHDACLYLFRTCRISKPKESRVWFSSICARPNQFQFVYKTIRISEMADIVWKFQIFTIIFLTAALQQKEKSPFFSPNCKWSGRNYNRGRSSIRFQKTLSEKTLHLEIGAECLA